MRQNTLRHTDLDAVTSTLFGLRNEKSLLKAYRQQLLNHKNEWNGVCWAVRLRERRSAGEKTRLTAGCVEFWPWRWRLSFRASLLARARPLFSCPIRVRLRTRRGSSHFDRTSFPRCYRENLITRALQYTYAATTDRRESYWCLSIFLLWQLVTCWKG